MPDESQDPAPHRSVTPESVSQPAVTMPSTSQPVTSQPSATRQVTSSSGNEITSWGKFWAGFLLIFFTLAAFFGMLAFWPDRLPDPTDKASRSLYECRLFHIRLLSDSELRVARSPAPVTPPSPAPTAHAPQSPAPQLSDSPRRACPDSGKAATSATSSATTSAAARPPVAAPPAVAPATTAGRSAADTPQGGLPGAYTGAALSLIHLNAIQLILVALAGFLGNMIHISTSFTSYVGAGKFKKSWLLWYFVKPFTAAGLAVIIYFALRAGFLNSSDNANNLSLFGILSLSALAGLFTDMATQKLQEIFQVIFKPKDNRPNKLVDPEITVSGIQPSTLSKTAPNKVLITGANFDKCKPVIKINDTVVNPATIIIKATTIEFTYSVPADWQSHANVKLSVQDDRGNEIKAQLLGLT